MKNIARAATAFLFAFTSVACQGETTALIAPSAAASDSSSKSAAAVPSLSGVTWHLVGINGQKALPGASVTAVFGTGKVLTGSGGCNRYVGAAVANDGKLTVSPLAVTKMFCGEPGVADQEDAYISALTKATGYVVSDTELRLNSGAEATLVFASE